jgi:hypothetical protein
LIEKAQAMEFARDNKLLGALVSNTDSLDLIADALLATMGISRATPSGKSPSATGDE